MKMYTAKGKFVKECGCVCHDIYKHCCCDCSEKQLLEEKWFNPKLIKKVNKK